MASRALAAGLTLCLCVALRASSPSFAPLDVRLSYNRTLDDACALVSGATIDPRWQDELEARLPDLRRAWASDGRPLLDRASAIAGLPLPTGRHDVRLTLCDIPSSSFGGTVVNLRHALASFTDRPVSLRYKSLVIAHEMLHPPLYRLALPVDGALDARTQAHVHLFAIIKAGLIDLGRSHSLEELVASDSRLPNPSYRRAWTIVNATPAGYRALVAEVRDTAPK